jgi:hypothetical protein
MTTATAVSRQELSWTQPADKETITTTIEGLKGRGISAELVPDRARALEALVRIIPDGAEVMTGASRTLEDIGFVDLLKADSHRWKNLKAAIQSEADPSKQMELRKRAALSQFFLGSVHAVAKTGEVIIASGGGSQLAAYAFSAQTVVWVVGTQKIVATLEDGVRRVREHSLPLEDKRMKGLGYSGSSIGKLLIVERERPGRIHLVFVNESLGF